MLRTQEIADIVYLCSWNFLLLQLPLLILLLKGHEYLLVTCRHVFLFLTSSPVRVTNQQQQPGCWGPPGWMNEWHSMVKFSAWYSCRGFSSRHVVTFASIMHVIRLGFLSPRTSSSRYVVSLCVCHFGFELRFPLQLLSNSLARPQFRLKWNYIPAHRIIVHLAVFLESRQMRTKGLENQLPSA